MRFYQLTIGYVNFEQSNIHNDFSNKNFHHQLTIKRNIALRSSRIVEYHEN